MVLLGPAPKSMSTPIWLGDIIIQKAKMLSNSSPLQRNRMHPKDISVHNRVVIEEIDDFVTSLIGSYLGFDFIVNLLF